VLAKTAASLRKLTPAAAADVIQELKRKKKKLNPPLSFLLFPAWRVCGLLFRLSGIINQCLDSFFLVVLCFYPFFHAMRAMEKQRMLARMHMPVTGMKGFSASFGNAVGKWVIVYDLHTTSSIYAIET
jgi:hypothetical protein